jgi:hypothetical protein
MPATIAQRTGGFLALLIASCGVIAMTVPRLDRPQSVLETDLMYLPKAEYLRPLSLGYTRVLADVLWFRTISYFGQHFRGDRMYPWLASMCDLVTDLDPKAEYVYRFCGMILPWEAGQTDAGLGVLEKGITAIPDSWLLHYWIGFNYYFFKNDFDAAVRHMRQAALLPGAHPNAAIFAAVLSSEHQGPETTMRLLSQLRTEVESPEMREVVREHIAMAQLARDLQQLDAAVASYQSRFGGIPTNLSALVDAQLIGEVPEDPFGGVYLIDPETGAVRSSTGRKPSRLHLSKLRKKRLRGESVRDF